MPAKAAAASYISRVSIGQWRAAGSREVGAGSTSGSVLQQQKGGSTVHAPPSQEEEKKEEEEEEEGRNRLNL